MASSNAQPQPALPPPVLNVAASVYANNEKVARAGLSTRRQFEWLERSKLWPDLPYHEWTARKVIGAGSYGLCGIWDYTGNDQNMPRRLAVKQSMDSEALEHESKFLHLAAMTGTEHIVKLYKGCHRSGGTGTDDKFDPLPFNAAGGYRARLEVARMYMEYVPGGDLEDFYRQVGKTHGAVIPEEHLWRMLNCFAKACMVLEFGTEDPNAPQVMITSKVPPTIAPAGTASAILPPQNVTARWRQIAHFDVKPSTVFIGERDAGEHQRLEKFKLADFGLSTFVPRTRNERYNPDWLAASQWRASPEWMSPEQYHESHPDRDIGSRTDIWAFGAIIREMITRKALRITQSFLHPDPETGVLIRVAGTPKTLLNKTLCPYSKSFIDTLCKCLAWSPNQRMTPKDLLATTTYRLGLYDAMINPIPPLDSLTTQNTQAFNFLPPSQDPSAALQNYTIPKNFNIVPAGAKPPWAAVDNATSAVSPDNLLFGLKLRAAKPPKFYKDLTAYPFTNLADTPGGP